MCKINSSIWSLWSVSDFSRVKPIGVPFSGTEIQFRLFSLLVCLTLPYMTVYLLLTKEPQTLLPFPSAMVAVSCHRPSSSTTELPSDNFKVSHDLLPSLCFQHITASSGTMDILTFSYFPLLLYWTQSNHVNIETDKFKTLSILFSSILWCSFVLCSRTLHDSSLDLTTGQNTPIPHLVTYFAGAFVELLWRSKAHHQVLPISLPSNDCLD